MDGPPLNWTVTLGLHNSYHVAPFPALPEWQYTHPGLTQQLSDGMRHFEFDLQASSDPADADVYHFPTYDNNSNCGTLSTCLGELSVWSQANPAHFPLIVVLESKRFRLDSTNAPLVEALVSNVWHDPSLLFTPAHLQAGEASVAEGLHMHGWPSVGELRGRVIVLVNHNNQEYGTDHGQNLFFQTYSYPLPAGADAAFIEDSGADAVQAVRDGLMVRARTDADYNPNTEFMDDAAIRSMYYRVMDADDDGQLIQGEFAAFLETLLGGPLPGNSLDQLWASCVGAPNAPAFQQQFACLDVTAEQVAPSLGINIPYLVPTAQQLPTEASVTATREHVLEVAEAQVVATDYTSPVAPSSFFVELSGLKPYNSYACRPSLQNTDACTDFPWEWSNLPSLALRSDALRGSGVAADATQCEQMCTASAVCSGWSFWEHSGWCRLMATTTGKYRESGSAVSGLVTPQCRSQANMRFDLGDAPANAFLSKPSVTDESECCTVCAGDPACAGFMYKVRKNKCTLLSSASGATVPTNGVSVMGWA